MPEIKEQKLPNNVKVNNRVFKLLSKLNRESPPDKDIQNNEIKINVEKHSECQVLPFGSQLHSGEFFQSFQICPKVV